MPEPTTAAKDQGVEIAAIRATQDVHTTALRAIGDQLDRIIEILTPPEHGGPTLDEILARLIGQIAEQNILLRRIDQRTILIATTVGAGQAEADGAGEGREAHHSNGHGGNDHDHTPP